MSIPRNNKPVTLQIFSILPTLALASSIVFALFLWQGHKGFNLWDEGYLWYGVQRVMLGEVPIRDFTSYDPGRYYWSSALMSLKGDNGIMALRGAVAVFQAIGLFAGLLLIARSTTQRFKNWSSVYLLLSAVTLTVWMFPRHKLFDISLSILLIGALAFLIQNPARLRYFICGMCVGLAAVFGRNHGVYGVVGSVGVMAWLAINPGRRAGAPRFIEGTGLWVAGVAVGFTPVLLMIGLVPDFAGNFWASIRFLFEVKATNLPLPIPWPWRAPFGSAPLGETIRGLLIGLFFIATVVFGVVAIAWVSWQKSRKKATSPILVAAAFLALPYAHYAYSRADVGHLAQGIFPLLIGCLALLAAQRPKIKWPLALLLCGASLWVTHISHPGWQCVASKQCVSIEISGDELSVPPHVANDVLLLWKLTDEYAPGGRSFIATPFWPGAYALLGKKSPMWETYSLFPRSEDFQREEIERIKITNPGFILVYDWPLDGREELRFRNSRPLIHRYIVDNFELLSHSPNPAYQIYRPRKPM
ncbi:hypothetical protein SAMN05216386_2440 [Nitrosospira briensis]|uniref:Glycosyltransferase RgtA/B/C/D-like domain-containing protein n=1 Tax=Nitrosospira briensis TaxID=35799 RepID=A0A1I5DWV2_9PROT|nr:hypothetical protein [Nitrosospira briensis]SFO03728.1 hypothetical protein SAMN05216386_2440 [Nitrosospira briensis]